ncbi:DUF362 domain-containing protein [Candidatus Magnetominusculus dajiuhuensis]|uniref:DUF362 domain-containing protein n=1 Tax=Candidatus Magnetominusculus dajiuhuensis TaxID=3137712 RepID=UPI003B4376C4
MFASIVNNDQLCYPEGDAFFSPSASYPEYPFKNISTKPNRVYHAVRECLAQSGHDAERFGTPDWNPLKNYIKQGDKVFLLCNFVYHHRPQESLRDFFAKCTHASILRALIDYVYIALKGDGRISFGNAPLQSCVWEQVLIDTGANIILEFYKQNHVEVAAKDLRLFMAPRNPLGQVVSSKEVHIDAGIIVRLDNKSLLDGLYKNNRNIHFRVADYNPDRIEKIHGLHRHEYIINKEILSSDVVFSVPKLKTHEKVGITVGLKGFVGCVGHKDCLAHHRFGSKEINGDEYPGNSRLQILLSKLHDFVYRRNYPQYLNSFFEIIDKNLRGIARRLFNKIQAGAWYGNDTAWRMTIDLAYIMHFANTDGLISEKPQRRHLVFIDGVIGGEGNGPLSPSPVDSRLVIFSDNVVFGDLIACKLMGYDSEKIPLLYQSERNNKLVDISALQNIYCIMNEKRIRFTSLKPVLNRSFMPPVGWKGYLS